MAGPYLTDASTYLINTLLGFYILAVMLRFLFQIVRADFYNPITQFLVTITNPPLRILRRWIPGVAGIDFASLTLMLMLKAGELGLIGAIKGYSIGFIGLLLLAVVGLLQLALYIVFFAIIVQVVVSWVAPQSYNPVTSLLYSLTEPVLRPARRMIPPIAGLDLSPLVAIVVLQLISKLMIAPLRDMVSVLALS